MLKRDEGINYFGSIKDVQDFQQANNAAAIQFPQIPQRYIIAVEVIGTAGFKVTSEIRMP